MKGIWIGAIMLGCSVVAVANEVIWVLGGPHPKISTSVDTRAYILMATITIGIIGWIVLMASVFAHSKRSVHRL